MCIGVSSSSNQITSFSCLCCQSSNVSIIICGSDGYCLRSIEGNITVDNTINGDNSCGSKCICSCSITQETSSSTYTTSSSDLISREVTARVTSNNGSRCCSRSSCHAVQKVSIQVVDLVSGRNNQSRTRCDLRSNLTINSQGAINVGIGINIKSCARPSKIKRTSTKIAICASKNFTIVGCTCQECEL